MGHTKAGPFTNGGTPALSAGVMDILDSQYDNAMADAAVLYGNDVRPWAPNTQYAAGQYVISPAGVLVSAKTAHLSSTTFTGTGSSGNWNVASPAPSALVFNILDFGGAGDRVDHTDAAISLGSNQLTSPSAAFTTAHVGKLVVVAGAGPSGDNLAAAITAVASGVATLSASASTSVSGGTVSVGTNNNNAIASAIAAVPTSGATIFFPRGNYMYSVQVSPPDHTIWRGEGKGVTVFNPCSTTHGFYRLASATPTPTPTNPPTGIMWIDLTVDGALATGVMKGWYLNHMKKCRWVRAECLNTGASGFGSDYLQDCSFIDCNVENAGRGGTISSLGCSGFGVGTGAFPIENVYFVDCIAKGNKRYGLFLENQNTTTQSTGAQIIGGRYTGNQWGVSDNGSDGFIVNGAHIVDNIGDGFLVTQTAGEAAVGINGLVTGCIISGNGGDGVQFNYTGDNLMAYGQYRVMNCTIRNNTGHGIHTRAATGRTIPGLAFIGNRIRDNGASGIGVFGGVLTNCTINSNEISGNGTVGTYTRGIMFSGDLKDTQVCFNTIFDAAASGSKIQQHGIWVSASAPATVVTGGRIVGNDVRNNGTLGMLASGISATTMVRDNDGYNPIGLDNLSLTGGSPFTYTAGGTPEVHYVIGGTFSNISINGNTVYNAGALSGTLPLAIDAGATVVYTYSVAPSAIKRWRH